MKVNLINQWNEIFYYLHSHPELAFEEYITTSYLKAVLEKYGIEILDYSLDTGVVARVQGKEGGKTVALRCDIDGLPVTESTKLPYASVNQGKMHACGHDFHMVVVIAAACLLKARQSEFTGDILFIFQPGEESSFGAKRIIEAKILDEVSAIYSLHASPLYDVGNIGIKKGSITASVDTFHINVLGKGCHAGSSYLGIDPIVASANIVLAIQTIISRNINPFYPGLISVTHVEGGNTWNVIPETVFIEGTVRATNETTRQLLVDRLQEIVEKTAQVYGASANIEWFFGPPAADNDSELIDIAVDCAREQGLGVIDAELSMGGEDFAYYQQIVRGAIVWVGTGKYKCLHHPKFQVDPNAIAPAAEYFAKLLEAVLKSEGGSSKGD